MTTNPLPDLISDESELENLLSLPTPALIDDLARLPGDLVVLGVGGKMGPSLARMARRALDASGSKRAVWGVARFSNPAAREGLEKAGVRTVPCDLLDREAVGKLPDAAGVMFMAGMKFGSAEAQSLTWAMNTLVPAACAERYRGVPAVVFSTGNIYPFVPVAGGGATEETSPGPVGDYAQSALGRERIYEHYARTQETPVAVYRLNYAAELRYGVFADLARKVRDGEPIDLAMGHFNAIWQGDANAAALRLLGAAASPPTVWNVTGPEIHAFRDVAGEFGRRLGKPPVFRGTESGTALISNAAKTIARFGPPTVPNSKLIAWVAEWVKAGGASLNKPTHFETRDGKF